MRTQLSTTIDIDAPPDRVWDVLADFASYAEWNPFIVRADGTAEPGNRLHLRMQPVRGRAVTVTPLVVEADRARRLRWRGRLGARWIFDAEHEFVLQALDGGGTRLRQHEEIRGVLVPFLARSLERGTLPAFEAMNRALKDRAEEAVAPRRG